MSDIVDARGLSCPQPVLLALSRMKEKSSGKIEVIVDNEVSRENVSRAARSQGWQVGDEQWTGEECRMTLTR